ncbi:MurR/RpiR family transcriptional regulator [Candidatus Bipolaricaulota bacterium]|nr:MurR/RpiR family transcriptional regulator [Candidatus Bipolaricaulota bacterium]
MKPLESIPEVSALKTETEMVLLSKSVLQKIKAMRHQFSLVETKIADCVVASPFRMIRMSTEEIASASGTSQASIIRFCQKLGYTGIKELKIILAQEIGNLHPKTLSFIEFVQEPDLVEGMLQQSIEGLQRSVVTLDRKMLDAAIQAISEARIVDIYGAGESYVVAKDLQIKLRRLGIIANVDPNPHLQAISATSLLKDDVAIGISFSGCTKDTLDAMEFASRTGATTIAITNFSDFPLAENANIVLETNAVDALSPYGIMPSRLSQHFVVDLLFGGLLVNEKNRSGEAYELYNKIIQRKMQQHD